MKIAIDADFMQDVGLADMPEAEKQAFIEHAQEELEVRVGTKINEMMSDAEAEEFARLETDEEVAKWLDEYIPDYREITKDVFEEFRRELIAERENILD